MNIKKILPIFGIIIFIIILFTLDFNEIVLVFQQVDPFFCLISFFAPYPLIFMVIIQWKYLLDHQKISVSYRYCLKNIFIGYFYGFITPGGWGAYTRSLYLKNESNAPLAKCVSNIVVMNTIDYIDLLILAFIGSIGLGSIFPNLYIPILLVLLLIIFLFIFYLRKNKSKVLFKKIIERRVFRALQDKMSENFDSFYEDLPGFRYTIVPFFLSLSSWILKYIILYFISTLFFTGVPILYFIFIAAIADVFATIPISVYGLGIREISFIGILEVFGVSRAASFSLSIFWFVIIWLVPSIIGAFVTIFETKRIGKDIKKMGV